MTVTESGTSADEPGPSRLRRAAVVGALGFLIGFLIGVIIGSWTDFIGGFGDAPLFSGLAGGFFGAGLVAVVLAVRQTGDVGRLTARVRQLEEQDALTGLANTTVLRRHLQQHLEEGRGEHSRTALIVIEVGDLPEINHSHGRAIGDEVVRAVVARIQGAMRPGDRLFRADGTRFALVAGDIGPVVTADRMAEELIEPLNKPYEFDNELIPAPAVIGVAVSDDQGTVLEDLLEDSAAAIYKAAHLGPGSIVRFEQSMFERNLTPATAHQRLEQALERGEFHLVYMPIRDAATARVVGVEALLRWTDERQGVVAAADFMEAMEQTGLIVPVGEWVMQEACRQATYWARTFPSNGPIPVTVNLSTRQVVQRDFVVRLHEALEGAETRPELLVLEVREQTLLSNRDGPWAALRAAKNTGVKLSLDNFGRGSSSLATLLTLRLDELKIHRSFIEAMEISAEDRAVLLHLIAMAKDLGLTTVADGVTRREQIGALVQLGCDQVQGHFVGKPTAAGRIDELLYRDISGSRSAGAAPDATVPPVPEPAGGIGLPIRTPMASGAGPGATPPTRPIEPAVVPAAQINRRLSARWADLFAR
jgi:diguanylate cyclase (GGDEF)-like protein